jgi:hypothetical protein
LRLYPNNEATNTRLDRPVRSTETFGLCHDDVWVVQKTTGGFLNSDRPVAGSLKTPARTVESRRADLERAHWKKVWRSMFED